MAEYIDLDTPLEVKVVRGSTFEPYTSTLRELLDVNHIPYTAADVRPVVSCCDCKRFQVNVSQSGYLPQGVPEWECRHWCGPTDPTGFCSYGKKREES